jgi:hypothetical protein
MNIIEEQEEWKSVLINNKKINFEISNLGGVRKVKKKLGVVSIKPKKNKYKINVGKGYYSLNYLVAMAFLPMPLGKDKKVIHKDGNKMNCRADNLAWVF